MKDKVDGLLIYFSDQKRGIVKAGTSYWDWGTLLGLRLKDISVNTNKASSSAFPVTRGISCWAVLMFHGYTTATVQGWACGRHSS